MQHSVTLVREQTLNALSEIQHVNTQAHVIHV